MFLRLPFASGAARHSGTVTAVISSDRSVSLLRMKSLVRAVVLNIHFIQLILGFFSFFGFFNIGRKLLRLKVKKRKIVQLTAHENTAGTVQLWL